MTAALPARRAYADVIDFVAGGSTPAAVVAFRPSEESRQRVAKLITKEKGTGLTPDEASELELCLRLEHILRLAKAKARRIVG